MHHRLRTHDIAAERFAHGLMAEAHAHDGQSAGKVLHGRNRNACFFRGARAGADDQILRFQGFDFFDGDFIVAANQNFLPQFGKVLDDVVGEAVVIVDK